MQTNCAFNWAFYGMKIVLMCDFTQFACMQCAHAHCTTGNRCYCYQLFEILPFYSFDMWIFSYGWTWMLCLCVCARAFVCIAFGLWKCENQLWKALTFLLVNWKLPLPKRIMQRIKHYGHLPLASWRSNFSPGHVKKHFRLIGYCRIERVLSGFGFI